MGKPRWKQGRACGQSRRIHISAPNLGGLPTMGGVLIGSGDGSVAGAVGSLLLKDGSSRAPTEEQRWRAAATSPLRWVAVCGGGNSFDGVQDLCAEASMASLAAVQRAWPVMVDHHGGVERCGGFRWWLPRWKGRAASSASPSMGFGVSPKASVWSWC
jgi:hypothetical protein